MGFNKKYDILEANSASFHYAIARGAVPGWSKVSKFGHNTDVDVDIVQARSSNGTNGRVSVNYNMILEEI